MTPPLLPKSCPAQVPSCLRYLLLAWPGTAITSPAQQRPTGGPRALPIIWEPNCLRVGDGGPRPCDDTHSGPPSPRRGPLTLPGGGSSARLANAIKL